MPRGNKAKDASVEKSLMSNINEHEYVVVGRIGKPYGIKGWVKIISYTMPVENILDYQPWYIFTDKWQQVETKNGRTHGSGIVAHLDECNNPEEAAIYVGKDIAIERRQLPGLEQNEYYWTDLEGLNVITQDGTSLGVVDYLFQSGENAVMVVEGERTRLIPFQEQSVIIKVDFQQKTIIVDWDPKF